MYESNSIFKRSLEIIWHSLDRVKVTDSKIHCHVTILCKKTFKNKSYPSFYIVSYSVKY